MSAGPDAFCSEATIRNTAELAAAFQEVKKTWLSKTSGTNLVFLWFKFPASISKDKIEASATWMAQKLGNYGNRCVCASVFGQAFTICASESTEEVKKAMEWFNKMLDAQRASQAAAAPAT